MGTSLDALNAPSSLTQRRLAASNLPAFELPPPPLQHFGSISQRIPPLGGSIPSHHSTSNLGHILTPPSNSASEGSSSSSAPPTGTTPNSAAVPVLPYTPTFFNTATTPTGYHTGYPQPTWQHGPSMVPQRSMFSPVTGSLFRHNTNSPTATEGSSLPPPPYDVHGVHPSYGSSLHLSSPGSGPNSAPPQHVMNGIRPSSQPSPLTPVDPTSKGQQQPSLFTAMPGSGASPAGYPYSAPTPVSHSPHPQTLSAPRISPTLNHGAVPQLHPPGPFMRPPPPSYSLPAMPGPIMSNLHSPGAHMAMVGSMNAGLLPMNFNSGYAANPIYGPQRNTPPQQPTTQDRPFKCDQCPQSFNRNHDLKRHKRIHLAVKPFPCNHCDKSFSRKDALKRHILVKGCGSGHSGDGSNREDGIKSDSPGDDISESPTAAIAA
ncbi:hypothetical protein PV10_05569 [Exophiala mesophila]|uniref:C2H2-type domain-containing protein n=1 Tax=Exophiala mesophila TaxID=212818 RepID=A0A0D1XS89_EXOME|nr:uncharacterized protein PV10_05569 [Exophiala mesophila]KIV90971.1 hypothetical protein PV10_05569 [Exophiala mesophila]